MARGRRGNRGPRAIPPVHVQQTLYASDGALVKGASQETNVYIRERVSPLPQQARRVSHWYIPRPDVVEPLVKLLLDGRTGRYLAITALHGMGGIGKTETVRALVEHPRVRAAFRGGVLWATLGQQPALLADLESWIQALDDRDFRAPNIDAASRHLTSLLKTRQTLLVIDDVWQQSHLEPFLVGGERCAAIVTTRRANVASAVGARTFTLAKMSRCEALRLAERVLGDRLLGEERTAAAYLFEALDYLPLAVQMAASRRRFGVSWQNLREAFNRELHRLKALDDPAHDSDDLRLRAVLNLSLVALKRRAPDHWRSFVEIGITPEDTVLTPSFAANLWECSVPEARERLLLLFDDALLVAAENERTASRPQAFTVHDLLLDVCRSLLIEKPPDGCGLSRAGAHGLVVSKYERTLRNGRWHTVARDGYSLHRLVWHMIRAERYETLYSVFRESTPEGEHGWSQVWEQGGHAGGFQGDLNLAAQAASEHYAATKDPAALGMQCLSILISSSLNSLAGLVPVEALLEMTNRGVWTFGQALGKAVSYPNPVMQTDALAGLAWIVDPENVPSVIEAAQGIRTDYGPTEVLLVALQRAEGAQGKKDFERIRMRLQTCPPGPERAAQLLELAGFAQGSLEAELIQAAAGDVRVEVGGLATRENRQDAKAEIKHQMRTNLDYRFPPPIDQRWKGMKRRNADLRWLERGVAEAKKINDRVQQLVCIAAFVPFLPSERRREIAEEIAAEVRSVLSGTHLSFVLARLGPELSPETLEETADWLLHRDHLQSSVHCLAAIIDQLEPAEAMRVSEWVMRKSPWLFEGDVCLLAIDAFADHLPCSAHPRLVAIARKLRSPEARAVAMMRVSKVVPEPSKSDLVSAARRCYTQTGDERSVRGGRGATKTDLVIRSGRPDPDFEPWVQTHSAIAFQRDVTPDLSRLAWGADLEGTALEIRLRDLEKIARCTETPDAAIRDRWSDACIDLRSHERPEALLGLATLAPVIWRLGGSSAALEAVTGIQQVARWWP